MLLSNKSDLCKDIFSLLNEPEYCDAKLESSDGTTILVNKTILSARSEYFRSMFSLNNNFVESQTGSVKMPYTKPVLEKLIVYLYSGELDCQSLELDQLLELMDLFNLFNLSAEFTSLEDYVKKNIENEQFLLSACLKGLKTSFQRGLLQTVGLTLLAYLGDSFAWICQMDEVGSLCQPLIIRLLQEKENEPSQTIHRFRALNTWLSLNSTDGGMTELCLQMFDLEHFTAAELASDVRKSGLYWSSQIMDRMAEICQEKDNQLENLREEKDNELENLREEKDYQLETLRREKDKALREQEIEMVKDLENVRDCVNNWCFVPDRIVEKYGVY